MEQSSVAIKLKQKIEQIKQEILIKRIALLNMVLENEQ